MDWTSTKMKVGGAGALVLLASVAGCSSDGKNGHPTAVAASQEAVTTTTAAAARTSFAAEPATTTIEPTATTTIAVPTPTLTGSQRNAVKTAKQYLNYTAFSRTGLIKQLEYENYSTEDATFAVDSLDVDYNQQAVKAARSYLDYTSFSQQGLVDQLVYEGYTQEQAEYGASVAYK